MGIGSEVFRSPPFDSSEPSAFGLATITMTHQNSDFHALGMSPKLLTQVAKLRFHTPTPIQAKTIPVAITGKDVIGVAQTGTGKTLAFGIPMIQRLGTHGGMGLVLVPTRELAQQVDHTLARVGGPLGLRTAVLIGGESIQKQLTALAKKPHVLVATPGRLLDHLDQRTVQLNGITLLVLDEADRMLDMGFAPQIKKILAVVPRERQTMLFSATMPSQIVKLSAAYMRLPVRVEIAPTGTTAERVTHELFFVMKEDKPRLLEKLLAEYQGSVLVFSRTKHGARKLNTMITRLGHASAEIHANRSLGQRRAALEGFRRGTYRVLVATDIAARGIDVQDIALVLNYDMPSTAEDYVHRIGRTARAGKEGHAISFATPDQKNDVRDIERLIRTSLPVSRVPELPPVRRPASPAGRTTRATFDAMPELGGGYAFLSMRNRHNAPPRRRGGHRTARPPRHR